MLHAILSPFHALAEFEGNSPLVLSLQKICETGKLESIPENSILQKRKTRIETRKKIVSEKTRVYVQDPLLKMPFKNSISDSITREKPNGN